MQTDHGGRHDAQGDQSARQVQREGDVTGLQWRVCRRNLEWGGHSEQPIEARRSKTASTAAKEEQDGTRHSAAGGSAGFGGPHPVDSVQVFVVAGEPPRTVRCLVGIAEARENILRSALERDWTHWKRQLSKEGGPGKRKRHDGQRDEARNEPRPRLPAGQRAFLA